MSRAALCWLGELSRQGIAVDPNRLYASQSSGWFGQVIQTLERPAEDGGPVGNKCAYYGVPGTHQWYDGTTTTSRFRKPASLGVKQGVASGTVAENGDEVMPD